MNVMIFMNGMDWPKAVCLGDRHAQFGQWLNVEGDRQT